MNITEIHQTEASWQIGGGSGFVSNQIRKAQVDARAAMEALVGTGNDIPVIGPYPREAALAATREAVIHLNEALSVVAPEDALIDTRHALEELTATIGLLEKMDQGKSIRPGDMPVQKFQRALELLIDAEHKLMHTEPALAAGMPEVVNPGIGPVDPNTPHIMNDNGGVVPPWLQ